MVESVPDKVIQGLLRLIPAGRVGKPEGRVLCGDNNCGLKIITDVVFRLDELQWRFFKGKRGGVAGAKEITIR